MQQRNRGYTLIEMAVVLVILGLIAAVSVPSFVNYRRSHELKSAAQNIAAQMRASRATAMVTGRIQRFHLYHNFNGYDYHYHDANGPIKTGWNLPKGVEYDWGGGLEGVDFKPDGRASSSLEIVLVRDDGVSDTVSVELSGMIIDH